MNVIALLAQNVWMVLAELAPWLLLGAGMSGLLHIALPPGFVKRQFSGPSGVLKAVALGIPMPLCSCGVIPTGIGLKKDGASTGAAIGFITATPQTGVDSILVSASFLGWPFALSKVFAALLTGVVSGWATDAVSDTQVATESAPDGADGCATPPDRSARAMLDHSVDLIRLIWGWLAFGVLVSAVLSTWLPADTFSEIAATSMLATFGVVLLASVPLYVCATASVPIAAALVAAGMPTGAAMVFLMAGPATNIATMGSVYRAFGARSLAIYMTTLIVGSVAFGMGFEAIFGALSVGQVHAHIHEAPWWGSVSAVLLTCLLVWFAGEDIRAWVQRRAASSPSPGFTPIEVGVGGMTCGGCSGRLERLLQSEPGVSSAQVSLEGAQARVIGDIELARVQEVIQEAGFEITG